MAKRLVELVRIITTYILYLIFIIHMYATGYVCNGAHPCFCAEEGLVERPPEHIYCCNVIVLL